MDKMSVYNRLPVWGQNAACRLEGCRIRRTRYGEDFRRFLSEYERHDGWSYEQLCDYRDARLRKMIRHCCETVPYYAKLFREGGIDPDRIKTLDDLKVLPILTKSTVQEHLRDFLSAAVPASRLKIHPTSGTTGSGLLFRTTSEEEAEQWAVWWRYRRRHGIEPDTWCGNFGGKVIVPIQTRQAPFYRRNAPCRQLYFSGYHISGDTWMDYCLAIESNQIQWLHGYPSNLCHLASYMAENGKRIQMKQVTVGAENLYGDQAAAIRAAFGVDPIQHYGLTEGVANISQLRDGALHIDEDFCAVELIGSGDGAAHIIGTSLSNFAMPLLRYDTGDLASFHGRCDQHGRIIDSLDGRQSESILLQNGSRLSGAAFNLMFRDFPEIREAQILQKSTGVFQIAVVKTGLYSSRSEQKLISAFRQRVGAARVTVIYTEQIDRTANGKFRAVISDTRG